MLKWDKIGLGGDGGSKKYKKRRTSFMYVPLSEPLIGTNNMKRFTHLKADQAWQEMF